MNVHIVRRHSMALALCATLAAVSAGALARAQTQGATTGPQSAASTNATAGAQGTQPARPDGAPAGEGGSRPGATSPWLLLAYVVTVVGFPFVLMVVDLAKSHAAAKELRDAVKGRLGTSASPDEVKALISDLMQVPGGIPGLARSALAFTLLLILAIAVFHLLVFPVDKTGNIVDKILTLLTGALTSITGFYFGGKAASDGAAAATGAQPSRPQQKAGSITKVTPPRAKPGDTVTIEGSGFGARTGTVVFGAVPGTPASWTDASVTVSVPTSAKTGATAITVNPLDGPAIVAPEKLFEVAP